MATHSRSVKQWFEQNLGIIYAAISALIWWRFELQLPKETESLLSATLNISGILVGFLATSKAILLGSQSSVMADIKKAGYYEELIDYLTNAISSNLLFCLVNVIGWFIDNSEVYGYIWISSAIGAFICFARVTYIMMLIFKYSK